MNTCVEDIEFLGNYLCLDFVNTVEYRELSDGTPVNDFLKDYGCILIWAQRAKLISKSDFLYLKPLWSKKENSENKRVALKLWEESLNIREMLYQIFSSIITSSPLQGKTIADFTTTLSKYHTYRKLVRSNEHFMWVWNNKPCDFKTILGQIVFSAEELLCSGNLSRLRQCIGKDCGWLFYDISKNGKRRWCDMKDCGNRVKASRFYSKVKQKG